MKTNILKVGDSVYARSIQNFDASYINGFPQREQYFLKHCKNINFEFFKHDPIRTLNDLWKNQKKLQEFLKQNSFDFILIDNPFSALMIKKDVGVPLIFDCIDWYDEMYLKEFGINKNYYLLRYGLLEILECANKVITQSPIMLAALKKWGLKSKNYTVIPNGYDKDIFYPYTKTETKKARKYIEEKYRIDLKNRVMIVYTGKLGKWYDNIKLIAEAVSDEHVFFIVGEGPIKNEIKNAGNIIKCGKIEINSVPIYTNAADVLVFPVNNDCSPIAISEYLAVGKPIVMGKGRMEWLLKNGKTGYMVDNNIFSWRNGIDSAMKNAKRIGNYNINISKDLSWQHLSKKFVKFVASGE